MSTIEVVLDGILELASEAADLLGLGKPVKVGVKLASLTLHTAENVAHEITADDLERVRQARELGDESGRAALRASLENFALKCVKCRMPKRECEALTPAGVHCCPACYHPRFWP
jgi:hypothetical protein